MRLGDFTLDGAGMLTVNAFTLDLHNDYDVTGFELIGTTVRVDFARSTGDWVARDTPPGLRFVFEDVTRLKVLLGAAAEAVPGDLKTLAFVGCLAAEDYRVMDGYLDFGTLDPPFHVIFALEDGTALKVEAGALSVVLDNSD